MCLLLLACCYPYSSQRTEKGSRTSILSRATTHIYKHFHMQPSVLYEIKCKLLAMSPTGIRYPSHHSGLLLLTSRFSFPAGRTWLPPPIIHLLNHSVPSRCIAASAVLSRTPTGHKLWERAALVSHSPAFNASRLCSLPELLRSAPFPALFPEVVSGICKADSLVSIYIPSWDSLNFNQFKKIACKISLFVL